MFRRFARPCIPWLTAAIAAACGSPPAADRGGAARPPAVAESSSAAASDAAAPPARDVLPPDALPAFSYAGIRYEPQEGAIASTPDGSRARARLVLRATAPSRFEVPLDAELGLTFANGAQVRSPLPSLGASQVEVIEVAGDVPAGTTWAGCSLSITEAGREPLRLRLGEDPAPPPDELEATESAKASTRYGDQVAYEVTGATFTADGPRRGGFYGRAPEGQRFLRTRIAVTNVDGRHGVSIGEESFALVTDLGTAPIAVGVNAQSIALGQRVEFEVIFLVPVEAGEFTLTVGADGNAPGRIQLRRRETGHSARPAAP